MHKNRLNIYVKNLNDTITKLCKYIEFMPSKGLIIEEPFCTIDEVMLTKDGSYLAGVNKTHCEPADYIEELQVLGFIIF
jgi:predicted transcriptional regulator